METESGPPWKCKPALPVLLAVAAVTLGVFWNSLGGGFVYDDHFLVENEPIIREFSFMNVLRIFTYGKHTHYLPVRLLSYAVDQAIWGMNPFGFHLTNVILHALNALLVAVIAAGICVLGGGMPRRRAWLAGGAAALLFALHPIQVESVAWISGRKDLLSTFFLLSSFALYMKTFRSPTGPGSDFPLFGAFILYIPAMFSKASVLGYPAALLAAEVLLKPGAGREPVNKRVERLLPFFLAGAAVLFADVFFSQKTGIIYPPHGGALGTHLLTISKIPRWYLQNILWPANLCPDYLYKPEMTLFSVQALLSIVSLAGIAAFFIYFMKRDRAAAFFIAWSAANLVPVMNLIPSSKLIADRYAYLPSIGLFCLAGHLAVKWSAGSGEEPRKSPAAKAVAAVLVLSTVAGLGYMSVRRNLLWRSDFSLWSAAMKVEPENPVVLHNMGFAYYERGDYGTAVKLLEEALKRDPYDVPAMVNLGAIEYELNGNTDKALAFFEKAAELEPHRIQVWVNLFVVYLEREQFEKALEANDRSIALDPYNQDNFYRRKILFQRAREKGVELKQAPPLPGGTRGGNYP